MANDRSVVVREWEHHAVTTWTELDAGDRVRLRISIGGYLLVKEGRVEMSGGHARFGTLDGPTKVAVGGGDIELIADTDVVFAPGTIRTRLGIVIDTDAGYQTELWEILGGNIRATHVVGYRPGTL